MIGEFPHFAEPWPLARKLFYNRFYDLAVLFERLLMLTNVFDKNILVVAAKIFINQIISGLMAQWQGA
jgi:hypothetical protein